MSQKTITKLAVAGIGLLLAVSACSSAPPANTPAPGGESPSGATEAPKKITLGFAQQTLSAPYYVAMQKEAERLAAEKGFELVFQSADRDPVTQMNQAETMVAQGVDGLMVNVINPGSAKAKMEELSQSVPLVFIDTGIPGVGVTSVQSDNVAIGEGAGKMMAERFEQGHTIKLAILNGGPRDELVGPARREGFLKGLEAGGVKYEIVGEANADYAQEKGVTQTESLLAAHPDVEVVFGYNDSMALGALQALRTAGNTKVLVAGIDGQREALAEINTGGCEGQYVSTGLNSPSLATSQGVEILLQIINGEKKADEFPEVVTTPAAGIGCSNIGEFYDPESVF